MLAQLGRAGEEDEGCEQLEYDTEPDWVSMFRQNLDELKVPPIRIEKFLLNEPSIDAYPTPARTKKPKKDKFEVEHLEVYRSVGLEWPPDEIALERNAPYCGKSHRKKEIMHNFHERLLPPLEESARRQGKPDAFLFDVNMSIRLINNPAPGTCPYLVGTSEIRIISKSMKLNRPLLGQEALNLQGFSTQLQNETHVNKMTAADMMDLAGNAFNGGVVLAVLAALIKATPLSAALAVAHNVADTVHTADNANDNGGMQHEEEDVASGECQEEDAESELCLTESEDFDMDDGNP